jgi:hypothetical protein
LFVVSAIADATLREQRFKIGTIGDCRQMRYTFECNSGSINAAAIAFKAKRLYLTRLAIGTKVPTTNIY